MEEYFAKLKEDPEFQRAYRWARIKTAPWWAYYRCKRRATLWAYRFIAWLFKWLTRLTRHIWCYKVFFWASTNARHTLLGLPHYFMDQLKEPE